MIRATDPPNNRRDIVSPTIPNAETAAGAAIGSVSDQEWFISRTHGSYRIPACAQGQSYSVLQIGSREGVLDVGDGRRFSIPISARAIAEDLIQDLLDHGVFLCATQRPSEEEVARARSRRDRYYHQLVGEADTLWARGHSFREISDLHRRAAIALGIEREWAYVPTRMVECPACGEKVKPGVAVCRHCRAILDAEKAGKHGLGPQGSAISVITASSDPAGSSTKATHAGGALTP